VVVMATIGVGAGLQAGIGSAVVKLLAVVELETAVAAAEVPAAAEGEGRARGYTTGRRLLEKEVQGEGEEQAGVCTTRMRCRSGYGWQRTRGARPRVEQPGPWSVRA